MKFEFPDTGEGVTEGKFLEWKIEIGDEVEEDQVVGEAETDKAVVEIPAPADGTVKDLMASPGDRVEVGDVIMELDTGDEAEEQDTEEKTAQDEEKASEEKEDTEIEEDENQQQNNSNDSVETSSTSEDILALPKVRKLAKEEGIDLASIKTGERITEQEVLDAADKSQSSDTNQIEDSESSEVNATPSVRKLAREKGIDIQKVEGSGRGGKVTRQDVIDAAESRNESGAEESDSQSTSEERETEEDSFRGEVERIEMSSIRKSIASKMEESRFTAPHVTHVEKADITELADLREKVRNEVDSHLTYLPFIMKASLKALKDYPDLNAELDESKDEIVRKKFYDFNIAVDTDRGLLVPKIDGVDDKNMIELAEDIVEKAEGARDNDLDREDMAPGTFSITNLGVIGGEEFTPIINYPQVAILGIGNIGETAEVVDGEVVPRTTVKLSLSYDHRVVDGATAAHFMNDLVENLENPEELMVNL